MATTTIQGDVRVTGQLLAQSIKSTGSGTLTGADLTANAEIAATQMAQNALQPYLVKLTDARVWDAIQTVLPGTPGTDDLGLQNGTFGTEAAHITAGDLKAAGATTRYARFLIPLPAEYEAAETVTLVISAGMLTTVADTSCTVDVECYKMDGDTTLSADLCATAATTINSLTFADKSFTITPTALEPGHLLDVRIAIACNDAATITAVEPVIGLITLKCDTRG
jgi:hypothetical protein